jgi:prepilin-type N-terminal cleavage/methylation domain-containing protein
LEGDIQLIDDRGYTLIETIVTLAILSIALTMVSYFFMMNFKSNKKISDLNELQYQAQVVNDYLVNRLSQSRNIDIDPAYDMITIDTYMSENNVWSYKSKRIMHKTNGDIFEEGSELAVYAKSMEFSVNEDNLVHYTIVFEKGKESFILENSVLMRNAVN